MNLKPVKLQKSHTCEEGGGTPQNFHLAFVDELWKPQKLRILKKLKKSAGDIIILHKCTCVPKTTIIWGTVPEIRSETEFFSFFCPFTTPLPNNPENQNFEKIRKASEDAIILNLCNKKQDDMMYAFSDMECNRHNFCHFRPFFALLPCYWPQKLKFGKNVRTT